MYKHLKYSVLRYSPNPITGERINLGILFSDDEINFKEFVPTKDFVRLQNFDDELDIEAVKALLDGIKSDIADETRRFDIKEYTKYYVNSFAFDTVNTVLYVDLKEMLDRMTKLYLKMNY